MHTQAGHHSGSGWSALLAGSPDDPEILVACLIVGGTPGHVIASQACFFWLLEEAAAGGQVCSCNVPSCDVGLRASIGSSQGGGLISQHRELHRLPSSRVSRVCRFV